MKRVPAVYNQQRRRKHPEKEQRIAAKRLCTKYYVFDLIQSVPCLIAKNIPVVHALSEITHFYQSSVVSQLRDAGVEPIATELAQHNLPLAGCLQYFIRNWEKKHKTSGSWRQLKGTQYLLLTNLANNTLQNHCVTPQRRHCCGKR